MLRRACEELLTLSSGVRDALRAVRERVAQDALPLLSLLQAEPLQMQSSHLSFQEYFAVRAICADGATLQTPPWRWSGWWANVVRLGAEVGDFGRRLLRAAGGAPALDLRGKLGGDRETSVAAVALLMHAATSINLSQNKLVAAEATVLAAGLAVSGSLTQVLGLPFFTPFACFLNAPVLHTD